MSLFTKKAYIGLDIGHHTLRAVQVERTTSGWRVARSASALTPDDTVRDGVVIDPTILGLAIKNLLKTAHINATSASIAISGGTVVVRPIRLPKMAESALRKSIRFEASRYVPNSVEDSYIEFEIIGDVDATNMDVIIAAAPKELVDSRVAACEQAGLEVEHVEIATFAAYRSIIEADHGRDWADKTVGLVDIGAAVTNLGVISNGAFSMTRAIPAGGQVLTDALKSYFKLSTEDAESGKSQLDIRGLLNEAAVAENPPLRILHTHVDDLVREVRRSINYWQSQQNEAASAKHVDVIVLCGGGSNLPGLSEYFQHKLGIETLALGVFDNPRFLASHSDIGHGLDMAVAVGLAMGLAPTHAVVRDTKSVEVTEVKAGKPPKPPKDPKPPKSPKSPKAAKGRTFKVTRPVESPSSEAETIESTEGVEIAAVLPTEPFEPMMPESAPLVAQAIDEEPTSPVSHEVETADLTASSPVSLHDETMEAPVVASATPEVEPHDAQDPEIEANVEDKYGPELAALIGAFESHPPAVSDTPTASDAVSPAFEEFAQPLSASQRMASCGPVTPVAGEKLEDPIALDVPIAHEAVETTSTGAPSASDSIEEPAPAEVSQDMLADATVDAPTSEFERFEAEPHAVEPNADLTKAEQPLAESPEPAVVGEAHEAGVLRSALLSDPVASTLNVESNALQVKELNKPGFNFGKSGASQASPQPKPAKAAKAAKPPKEAKAKKPLFSRAPKPEKVSQTPTPAQGADAGTGSAIKKAASWLFGGPKEHIKPSGKLTPRVASSDADLNETAVASRDAEIELLRGTSLEPVDTTLNDLNPEATSKQVEPEASADFETPKGKARKTPDANEPQTPDPETNSKKEAA